jgi:hypothetical protein
MAARSLKFRALAAWFNRPFSTDPAASNFGGLANSYPDERAPIIMGEENCKR